MSLGVGLGAVGGVIGSYFGPIGAQLGYMAGSLIGNMIDPPKGTHTEGPKLDDLSAQTASYGTFVGTVYGMYKRAGNVFWATTKKPHTETDVIGGGKGSGPVNTQTTTTYTQSFAIGLSDNEILGVKRIWANYELIYSTDELASAGSKLASSQISGFFRVYNGTEEQLPDPTMEAEDGVGEVPAYRGLAYIIFTDFPLSNYGNAMPNLQFEVVSKGSGEVKQGTIVSNESSDIAITEQFGTAFPFTLGGLWSYHFFQNSIKLSHAGKFDVWDYPLIKNIAETKSELYPTEFYENGIRKYFLNRPINEDVVFNIDYSIANIYQYRDKDMITERYINPPDFKFFSVSPVEERIMSGLGQLEKSEFAIYLNSAMIDKPFAGASGLYEEKNSVVSVGRINVADVNQTTFFAVDNMFPAGEYFKGALITEDQNFGYIFHSNAATNDILSTIKYSKFVLDGQKIKVIETGVFEEQMYFVGVSSKKIDMQNVGTNTELRFKHCSADNKYLWLLGTGPGSVVSIFENDNKVFKRKNNLNVDFTNTDNIIFQAKDGLMYMINQQKAMIYSAIEQITVSKVFLNEIIADQFSRVGLEEEFYDVSETQNIQVNGYLVGSQSSARANIETISNAYFFDVHESDGKLKAKLRGREVAATITSDEFIVENESSGEARSEFILKRFQEMSLPAEVQVNFTNLNGDYARGVQFKKMENTSSVEKVAINVPILLTDDEALHVAETSLYNVWIERETVSFSTNIDYYYLEPTDVIQVYDYEGKIHTLRIIKKDEGDNGVINWECVGDQRASYIRDSSAAVPENQKPAEVQFIENVEVIPMNLPLILDSMQDQSAYYLGASAKGDGIWNGSVTYKSYDRQNFSMLSEGYFDASQNSIYGIVQNPLSDSDCFDFDNYSKIRVTLRNKKSELSSRTYDEILNYKVNYALIGQEVVQFIYADLVSPGVYDLYGFIRGMHGTEVKAKNHKQGEMFVLLDMNKINTVPDSLGSINSEFWLAGISIGKSGINLADQKKFANNGLTIMPLAPYSFENKLLNGDFNLFWYRRARRNAGLINNIDVPLDEQSEQYVIEVFSDNTYSNVINTYTINNDTKFIYTTSMQNSDFGNTQSNIFVKIYQISSRIGKGFASIPKIQ